MVQGHFWLRSLVASAVLCACGAQARVESPTKPIAVAQAAEPVRRQPLVISAAALPNPSAAYSLSTPLGAGLRKVWEAHPDVQQALAEVRAAEYDINGAFTGYYPFALLQNVQSSRGNNGASGSSGNTTVARVTVPIYSGGSTVADVDAARARRAQSESNLGLIRQNLGLRYGDAYFAALAAQNQVDLLEQNLVALRRLNQTIARRAQEGAAPDADVKTAVTRLRLAESQLSQARAQELTQRMALKSLQGEEAGNLAWPDQARLSSDELTQALARATDASPSVLRANADIDLQEAQARANRSRLSPEVQVQYSRGLGARADRENFPEQTQLVVQFQTDNGLRGYESWRSAQERLKGANAKRLTALRDLDQIIASSRTQIESLTLQLRSQKLAVEASVQLVDSFLRQYNAGRKTWIEVLNAQREAVDTQLQYVGQQQNYWQSLNRLALSAMYWDEWTDRTADAGVRNILEIKP